MKSFNNGEQWITNGSKQIAIHPNKAIKWIKQGMKENPEEGIGWFNLGLAYHQTKQIDKAIKCYRKGLDCKNSPEMELMNNLAQDLLLNGEFEEGWDLYEYRRARLKKGFETFEKLYGKPWEGFKDERKCSHLIVVAEQGYGDTIQFCRFILTLQQYGIQASLFCQEALANLLRSSNNFNNIITSITNSSDSSYLWCPLMSLPKHLKLTNENIPFGSGYIYLLPEKTKEWKKKLQRDHKKKLIALHWQGNPKFEKSLYSRGRSMDPIHLKLLSEIEGVEFISIQKGDGKNRIKDLNELDFVEGQVEFDKTLDFMDTAAVLSNCDLLISTDSSVVHLAGALKIPTWIALAWVPEWRWGLKKLDTNWYESVVLYRQYKASDWNNVIKKIVSDLPKFLKTSKSTLGSRP